MASLQPGDSIKTSKGKDGKDGKEAADAKPAKEEKKEKTDGGNKVLYGVFRHLLIRKSGPSFRMDRIDKNPDAKIRKQFGDKVTIEVQKEVLLNIEKKEKEEKENKLKEMEKIGETAS